MKTGEQLKAAAQKARANANQAQIPPWLKPRTVNALPNLEPPQIIKGILYQGAKLSVSAGSKSMKTWLLLFIAYCLANGLDLLGFQTAKVKVIYFDFELMGFEIRKRLEQIQSALARIGLIGNFDNILPVPLREYAEEFLAHLDAIEAVITDSGAAVIILDPIYKMLLGLEENSNGIVAQMLNRFTKICGKLAVSFIYANHHSKGNQALKDALDRSSGAGAWSRDPDAVFDLTAHEESDCFTAEIRVRSFPPIDKFVVRWQFPLLIKDTQGLDPERLKRIQKNGQDSETAEKILTALRAVTVLGETTALSTRQIGAASGVSSRTVRRWVSKLASKVIKAPLVKNGWQLSLGESDTLHQLLETMGEDE